MAHRFHGFKSVCPRHSRITALFLAVGPNVTLHFLAMYADPRGMNLRNEIARTDFG